MPVVLLLLLLILHIYFFVEIVNFVINKYLLCNTYCMYKIT